MRLLERCRNRAPQRGQAIAEYIIIILFVAIAVAVGVKYFGKSVSCGYYWARKTVEVSATVPNYCTTTSTSSSTSTSTSTSTTTSTSTSTSTSTTLCLGAGTTKQLVSWSCPILDYTVPTPCCHNWPLSSWHNDYWGYCGGTYDFVHTWVYYCG